MTTLEAFNAMKFFLKKYYHKTLSDDIGSMLGDLQFFQPDTSADPAAWVNWEKCVHRVTLGNNKLTYLEAFHAMRFFLEIYCEETSSEDIASILKDVELTSDSTIKNPHIEKEWIKAIYQADQEKYKLAQLM